QDASQRADHGDTPLNQVSQAVQKIFHLENARGFANTKRDEIRENVRDSGQYGAIISLDVSSAFDSAFWPAILARLKRLGIPHNLWYLCRDYFRGRVAKLQYAGVAS